jgi:hypothetical protein
VPSQGYHPVGAADIANDITLPVGTNSCCTELSSFVVVTELDASLLAVILVSLTLDESVLVPVLNA